MSNSVADSHNPGIDTLRALAALLVVLHHMTECDLGVFPVAWSRCGGLGVNLFFALSGFLIVRSALQPAVWDGRRYLRQRALRILPNYYIILFFSIAVIGSPGFLLAPVGQLAGDFATHLTLTHGWFSDFRVSILGPLWTLSHEATFYLLVFLVAPLLRSSRWWVVPASMLVLAVVLRWVQLERWVTFPCQWLFPPCVWDQFAPGMAMAWLSRQPSVRAFLARPGGWWLVMGAALVLVGWAFWRYTSVALRVGPVRNPQDFSIRFDALFYKSRSNVLWFTPVLALGSGLLVLALWEMRGRGAALLRRTPLPWMGLVSYSTYLWHMAVVLCFFRILKRTQLPVDSLWHHPWPRFILTLTGVYLLSAFAYQFFEWPWLKRKESLRPGGGPPGVP